MNHLLLDVFHKKSMFGNLNVFNLLKNNNIYLRCFIFYYFSYLHNYFLKQIKKLKYVLKKLYFLNKFSKTIFYIKNYQICFLTGKTIPNLFIIFLVRNVVQD